MGDAIRLIGNGRLASVSITRSHWKSQDAPAWRFGNVARKGGSPCDETAPHLAGFSLDREARKTVGFPECLETIR